LIPTTQHCFKLSHLCKIAKSGEDGSLDAAPRRVIREFGATDPELLTPTTAMIEETRKVGEKTSTERRFFISSLPSDAKQIALAVRAHWLIENALHWTLDVVFNEDNSRVRKDSAGENMAIVRHITLNMLNNSKKSFKNVGLKALRKKAGWGNETLEFILKQNF